MKKLLIIFALFFIVILVIISQRDNVDEDDYSDQDVDTEKVSASIKSDEQTNTQKEYYCSENSNEDKIVVSENLPNYVEIPAPLKDRPEQIIRHTGYILSYNSKHNTPNWTAWELTSAEVDGTVPRSDKFWADPSVSSNYRVDWYEYKDSGYDRGHMCPSADMKWSEQSMHDCFYMTNMCPQDPNLNGGAWKDLEEACRQWAITEGSIYIVCGPIYTNEKHETIGIEHSIDVPEGFFKVVLSLNNSKPKGIGFYYSNNSKAQSMSNAAVSIDDIEELTGIDFFYNLDDEIENKLESSYSISSWK